MEERVANINGFLAHQVTESGKKNGTQYITDCRFCSKADHFYINMENRCWDCKVCARAGNFLRFLEECNTQNQDAMTDELWKRLAADRKLPVAALKGNGIGWDGVVFTIPAYDFDGKLQDLKRFDIDGARKVYGTQGGAQTMICGERLRDFDGGTVYLCEGQWDTFAMQWLLKKNGKTALAVGVPGATIFKEGWEEQFYKKDVYLAYDHDNAGRKGETKVWERLQNVAHSVYCLHWPEDKVEGYDLRDHVSKVAVSREDPQKALRLLSRWFSDIPRVSKTAGNGPQSDETGSEGEMERRREKLTPISFTEVIAAYHSYLEIKDDTPIRVMLASIFANRMQGGEMIWMFLVAPPSTMKSELVLSLDLSRFVHTISKFTPATLVSGFVMPGKKDCSLLNRLDGKTLAIKDYTTILTMNKFAQDEIHGTLRDAYDGKIEVEFGNGIIRRYKARFGIIAAVTGSVEKLSTLHQSLGERFLRYSIPVAADVAAQKRIFMRALSNVTHEDERRKHVQEAVARFLETHEPQLPTVSDEFKDKLFELAAFTSRMRGFVEKDFKGIVLYKPAAEAPTRIGKQLYKLGMGLAMLENREALNDEDYRTLVSVGIASCPGRVESIVKAVLYAERPLKISELVTISKFPYDTVREVVGNMVMVRLLEPIGKGMTSLFKITDECMGFIKRGAIYPLPGAGSVSVRIRRR